MCACTIVCLSYFALSKAQALRGPLDSLVHNRRLLDAQHSGLVNSLLTHGNVTSFTFHIGGLRGVYTSGVSENKFCSSDGFEAYTTLHQKDADVSACICVRDEGVEVLDWIAHHQKMGENQFCSMSKLTLHITRTKSKKRLIDWMGGLGCRD